MGKKYIVIGGKKHYLDEKQIGDDDSNEIPPDSGVASGDTPPGDQELDAATEKAAKSLAKTLRAELGIDELKDTVERVKTYVDSKENAKLKALLHGKDLVADKDTLTKEEKIVGFFHALVTENEAAVKALSEGVAADGGNLFPAEFVNELIKPLSNPGTMRSLVRVVPVKRNSITAPTQGNRPKIYWTAENAAKTTTTASWGQKTIVVRKAAAILYSSDELIEDSTEFDVVQMIIDMFAEAITEEEDRVILRGNGTTEPRGIETARAAGDIATISFGGTTTFDKIKQLKYSLRAKYRRGATFIIHPNKIAAVDTLKDLNNRYIWQDAVTTDAPASLVGHPVSEQYDVPENTIYFGNWKLAYWLLDRKQMTVKVTNDETQAFNRDQTAIRVVIRLGGDVVLGEAAKAANNA